MGVSFDPQLTEQVPFKGGDGRSADVAMMRLSKAKRSFRQEHNFVAVDLPFTDNRFSLAVVTTVDRPAHATEFAGVGAGFTDHSGDLALPRFFCLGTRGTNGDARCARSRRGSAFSARLGIQRPPYRALRPMRCCRRSSRAP
jgi:hypothetical protein